MPPRPKKQRLIIVDAYSKPQKRIIKGGGPPGTWRLRRVKKRQLKKWMKGDNPNIRLSHGAHPANMERFEISQGMDPETAHLIAYGKPSKPKGK